MESENSVNKEYAEAYDIAEAYAEDKLREFSEAQRAGVLTTASEGKDIKGIKIRYEKGKSYFPDEVIVKVTALIPADEHGILPAFIVNSGLPFFGEILQQDWGHRENDELRRSYRLFFAKSYTEAYALAKEYVTKELWKIPEAQRAGVEVINN